MQSPVTLPRRPQVGSRDLRQPLGGLRFDYAAAVLASWLIGGLYLDGWAHLHIPELETFFTPWHGVLYSGFLALAALLVGLPLWNRWRFGSWEQAVPRGYGLALLGTGMFALGGAGDMIWHILFGIESDVEALLSPTHLVLAVGAGLMVSGPLRAAWYRRAALTWSAWIPILLSAITLLSLLTFFTSYIHPFIRTSAAEVFRPLDHEGEHANLDTGIAAVLLQTVMLMGIVLLLVRRWHEQLPFGSLALLLGVNIALVTTVFDQGRALDAWLLVAAAGLAGLTGDVMLRVLRPSPKRSLSLRAFGAVVPIMLYSLYFGALALTSGIWWTVHLWTGTIAMAGIAGWLVTLVMVPVPQPRPQWENMSVGENTQQH